MVGIRGIQKGFLRDYLSKRRVSFGIWAEGQQNHPFGKSVAGHTVVRLDSLSRRSLSSSILSYTSEDEDEDEVKYAAVILLPRRSHIGALISWLVRSDKHGSRHL